MQTASKRTNIFVSFVHSNKINTKKKMFLKTVVKMRWQNGWYEKKENRTKWTTEKQCRMYNVV